MIKKAGVLRAKTNQVEVAEMHCIANALHTLKHSKFAPITSVHIYTDSLIAYNIINNQKRKANFTPVDYSHVVDEIYFLMMEICLREGKSIRDVKKVFTFNHVKAHTGQTDKMSLINDWCDKEAKRYRVKADKKKVKK